MLKLEFLIDHISNHFVLFQQEKQCDSCVLILSIFTSSFSERPTAQSIKARGEPCRSTGIG